MSSCREPHSESEGGDQACRRAPVPEHQGQSLLALDIQQLDIIEAYQEVEVKKKLK
jgi:hypothetical protein